MKQILKNFALIFFSFFHAAFGSSLKGFSSKNKTNQPAGNYATLIRTSLEEDIKKPQKPISVSLSALLDKNAKPTDRMSDIKVFNHADYVAISIKGEIPLNLHYDIDLWLQRYDKNNDKALIFLIQSIGGYTIPVQEIAKKIDTQRLTTIVIGYALSSAAHLFLLGKQKLMVTDAKLGFHASRIGDEKVSEQKSFHYSKSVLFHYKNLKNKKKWETFLLNLRSKGVFNSLKMSTYTAEELLRENLIQMLATQKIIIDKPWLKPNSSSLKCKLIFL